MRSVPAPHTHGRPMPRATTAAWLVMPPRAVRMPAAACMPWMSSGLVSMRTRITSRPWPLSASASSASNTISPEAAPGDAGRPVATTLLLRGRVDGGVQELVERRRHRCAAPPPPRSIRPSATQVDGDLERRLGRALAGARLQHPELAVLDGELDVLHVAVAALRARRTPARARRRFRASAPRARAASRPPPCARASVSGCGVRMPATTSSPWALTRNSP